jgi:hypothetical protein
MPLRTTFQPVQCNRAGRKNEICLTLSPPTYLQCEVDLGLDDYRGK